MPQISPMSPRRTWLIALALAGAVAFYFWRRNHPAPEKPKTPAEIEAIERAKADPFPAKQP
jgi:hypothetical protein